MKYRIQRRDQLGIVKRGFGGMAVKWSTWRTIKTDVRLDAIAADFDRWSKFGLSQWRICFGKEVVKIRF